MSSIRYQRYPGLDRRIGNGDDFAGDAWVRWTAVGQSPIDSPSEIDRLRAQLDNSLGRNLCPDHRDKQVGKPPSQEVPKPVCWFKHGPYEKDEPLTCVFSDPHDDDCYSPLYFYDVLHPLLRQRASTT